MPLRSDTQRDSRYVQGGLTEKRGSRVGWWDRFPIPRAEDDIALTITPKYNRRPDLLAYDVYGKTTLTWLVLQYNNINDVNVEFATGSQITLPSVRRVMTEILTKVPAIT